MRKLTAVAIILFGVLVGGVAQAATEHCPDGTKTEGTHNSVVLPVGTEFCVKASNETTGVLISDGEHSLIWYVEESGIVNGQGNPHDVSYYVVYQTTTTTTTEVPPSTTDPTNPSDTTSTTTTDPKTTTTTPSDSSIVTTIPVIEESTTTSFPTISQPPQDTTPTPGIGSTPLSTPERGRLPNTGTNLWTVLLATGMLVGGLALIATARRRI